MSAKSVIRDIKDIRALGTVLTVWAHPDDECFYAAGLIAAARVNGQTVCCVTATKGEGGSQDPARWPPEKMGRIREAEMEKAMAILGVKQHHWLGYVDGQCEAADAKEAVAKLVPIIEKVRPDSVITFGPAGSTGHPDHMAVCAWTGAALSAARLSRRPHLYHAADSREWYERSGKRIDAAFDYFFAISPPPLIAEADMDLRFVLPDELLRTKLEALRAHTSQTSRMFAEAAAADLRDMWHQEGFLLADY
jgi:LmbE family N-acetylglucosaminyl deacetylase